MEERLFQLRESQRWLPVACCLGALVVGGGSIVRLNFEGLTDRSIDLIGEGSAPLVKGKFNVE